jgi:hypothetical protein
MPRFIRIREWKVLSMPTISGKDPHQRAAKNIRTLRRAVDTNDTSARSRWHQAPSIRGLSAARRLSRSTATWPGKFAFARQQWKEAETAYNEILDTLPESDAAPEALYWRGVSRYKSSGDPTALQQTAEAFKSRYAGSTWAKKASVWSK